MQNKNRIITAICLSIIMVSCTPFLNQEASPTLGYSATTTEIIQVTASADATVTPTPFQPEKNPDSIYWSPSLPQEWIQDIGNLKNTKEPDEAELILDLKGRNHGKLDITEFIRLFAVGAPFDTVVDNISFIELQAIWSSGATSSAGYGQLFMTEATEKIFTDLLGTPSAESVSTFGQQALVSELWKANDAIVIIPFEEIEPRLKILSVDGISPIDRPMDVENYSLKVNYVLSGSESAVADLQNEIEQIKAAIPATNRDESKMTVVMMTGTTALARVTLKKIELNGYDYPVELVKDWFLGADLRHVSNEVSFMIGCEYVDAYTMQFCSKPDQIKVLENIGVNVVESTGNHLNDYPGDAFASTLAMYEERGWLSYGGGMNADLAGQPATTEVNGNKIAFIGCNPVGPETGWATDIKAGSANCDYPWFNQKISELKSQGYVVIATFQAWEIDKQMYDEYYRITFKDAVNAGADIVQGSQAHVPMGFEFVNNSLIHYGLGNFLFDQMEPHNIREFYDRHIIYNGKYISTELLTATLTDWSRPVPMTEKDRSEFLEELFTSSKMRKK